MSARAVLRNALRFLGRPAPIGAAVALAVILSSLYGAWDVAELKLLDRHLRVRGPVRQAGDVVIVGIGEDTFSELDHPWPFPRAWYGRAVESIAAARPRAIGIDVLFTEPSLFGPEDDAAFSASLRRYDPVVLAALFWHEVERPVHTGGGVVTTKTYQVLRLPVRALPREPSGFANVLNDPDGFVRRVPLYLDFRTAGRMESFAVQIVKVATRYGPDVLPSSREMLINFRGPTWSFETVSFHQVLRGDVRPETFAGKVVLIGATSPVLHDVSFTPFTPRDPMPGVEIQANAVDNLLRGDPLRPAGRLVSWALAVFAAIVGTGFGSRIRPPKSFLRVAAIGCGIVVTAHAALVGFQVWIAQVPIHLALFGTYFAVLVSGAPFKKFAHLSPPASLVG